MTTGSKAVIVSSLVAIGMTTAVRGTAASALPSSSRSTLSARGQSAVSADAVLIAKGDSVFHGKLGGAICAVCHGQNAKGMPSMGPDLTDTLWLHGDGSLRSIEATVRTGVPKPKKSPTVMPPMGGVPLDSAKVIAVAAYVYSLSARR